MIETLRVVLQVEQQTTAVAGTTGDEHYHVSVLQAPGHGWGGPMAGGELETGEVEIIRMLYREFLQHYRQPLGEMEIHPLRVIGNKLYQAFPESVQRRLVSAIAMARAAGKGMTLTLRFAPSAENLLNLPWELLHHPEGTFFFALHGGGIVRQMVLPLGVTDGEPEPHTVVGLWSEPLDGVSLRQRGQVGPSPENATGIRWRHGPDSVKQLQQALASGEFDGVHIVAHGRMGAAWGSFALALTDGNNRLVWVTTDQLATLLSGYPQVRFLYLDVCGSGADSPVDKTNELVVPDIVPGGVARRLLGIGIGTVIVMQDVMGQAAAGLVAEVYYKYLWQGHGSDLALAAARRAVRIQQDDVIHWSVPALYRLGHRPPMDSLATDWVLDYLSTGRILALLLPLLVLGVLIGRLSYLLAQVQMSVLGDWLQLPALLVATNLLPLLAAAMTVRGQGQLGVKYGLHGRSWLPFLIHKYFGVFLWTLFVWLVAWGGWLGIYGAGGGEYLPWWGRQTVWLVILSAVALMAHLGARQAVRQSWLFFRVGTVVFPHQPMSYLLLLFVLLLLPFFPLIFGVAIWWLYLGVTSLIAVPFDLCLGVCLMMFVLLWFVLISHRE